MSIRYKMFCAFSVVIALACGLAFYGVRGISSSGDLVVRLYDGPLMAINHARSAHAALSEVRPLMQRAFGEGASREAVARIDKLLAGVSADLKVVGERVKSKDVTAALGKAEQRIREWSDAANMIVKPPASGVTALPAIFTVQQKSDAAVTALD